MSLSFVPFVLVPFVLLCSLGKVYNFGFAIHDDYTSARYHHVSFGYKLALDNDQAEVNVKKL
ncbi:hypothetical protein [Parendozoicomonas sp. Alg238-R29]|uniref:hypothetical protein n=1 Tax=Parendozoicomonas sp. Alg238-R29 TaxID=2993446 RepID=UPI00248EFFA9|nr:hypothetical protein [Parendozoicomonas sp. Alg238-R29]